jgi:hypothetical protein
MLHVSIPRGFPHRVKPRGDWKFAVFRFPRSQFPAVNGASTS